MRKSLPFLVLTSVLPVSVLASDFEFFKGREIDYWNDNEKKGQVHPVESVKPVQKQSIKSKSEKNWKTYLEPKSIDDLKEFFREGEHTPPIPLLMGIQNPTYKNARRWLEYIRLKNRLAAPFLEKLKAVSMKESNLNKKVILSKMTNRVEEATSTAPDFNRYRFRMYFDSNCPHCKRMFSTLGHLKQGGYYVEAIQIDSGPRPRVDVPVFQATKKDLEKYGSERVPFTLVADTERNRLIGPIRGYHPIENVQTLLKQASKAN